MYIFLPLKNTIMHFKCVNKDIIVVVPSLFKDQCLFEYLTSLNASAYLSTKPLWRPVLIWVSNLSEGQYMFEYQTSLKVSTCLSTNLLWRSLHVWVPTLFQV